MWRTASTNSAGRSPLLISFRNVTLASAPDATRVALDLGAVLQHHAPRRAVLHQDPATSALVRISAPCSRAAEAIALLIPPMPPRT